MARGLLEATQTLKRDAAMPMDLDSALGLHADALSLRARRAELLAANLAHADTPGYRARDLDFRAALAEASEGRAVPALATTHPRHLGAAAGAADRAEVLYRHPHQAAVDGNTVDTQREHAEFMQNALQYQASLTFLSARIRGLLTAIRGE